MEIDIFGCLFALLGLIIAGLLIAMLVLSFGAALSAGHYKDFAIATFIALIISCFTTDFMYRMAGYEIPAYPVPVGLKEMGESALGLRHDDIMYPELNYTDSFRPTRYMSKIDENSLEHNNIDFPLGANN
jgi:hypothetical protein